MTEDQDGVRRQEIASRVIYWMNRRGFTRKLFADRLGKSVSWVDKIKSGDRQLDRLSVLEHIADVLDIELRVLLDAEQAVQTEQCADEVEITALQEALQRYEGICGTAQLDEDPNLDDLRRTLHYCWTAFQASSYQAVTRLLPDFLVALQQAYRGATEPSARERAADYLTQAYWLAAEIAFKLGRIDLGWLAADR
ncbi:MAG TPA: helix-turn-helix domain-containing protein, partial [Pseudonocardiaceae bacterium]|nr:helix-turn-helix domain-containing protein [Pseudonocardiaceae bacterium]